MNKLLIISIVLGGLLSSCSSEDAQFCECMKVSKDLNDLSAEVLETGADEKKAEEHRKLNDQKKKICKEYETMSGEEMLKRKKNCEEK
ncbi:MAG: hypothetical protein EP305_05860 [Bacteroidetes bacterium]|nr:MAG: hypothetical protein EP305_05860 [Bacteroidota bacterium]